MSELSSNQLGFMQRNRFWIFLFIAFLVHQIPIVSIPFKWLETYFHEISHGIAALITGGSIIKIELFPNGAGLCTTRGGFPFLISFMGYAGATIWGVIIYSIGRSKQKYSQLFSSLLIILLVSSMLFWVRDVLTFVIIIILLVLFLLPFKYKKLHYLQTALKLTGAMVLLNSLYSPLALFDGRQLGDGATLANLTFIPEFIWVLLWLSFALFSIYLLGKNSKK